MSKRFIFLILLFWSLFDCAIAQSGKPRTLSSDESAHTQSTYINLPQSIKIENSNIWVNGNLLTQNEVPAGLRNLDPNYSLQLTSRGKQDLRIYLQGNQYVVHQGRLIEIPADYSYPSRTQNATSESDMGSKEQYYSTLKNEEPGNFYNLKKEAQLYERCMQLVLEFQMASGKTREKIREEIRLILGEQFDMNILNMEKEVSQLEKELIEAKEIIGNRKQNKTPIIEKRLKELTD